MTMIAATTCPTRRERVLTQTTDGELVLLHLDRGTYFALNEVGARIWELWRFPAFDRANPTCR